MKNTAVDSEKQINPVVAITYTPVKALEIIGHDSLAVLGHLQGAKITSLKTLESASEILHDGEVALERIVETREQFASRVKEAFEPFRKLPLFQGASINITLTIPLRQQIEDSLRRLKSNRAQYLAAEQEKVRQAQLKAEADQAAINKKAADAAAAAAKKAGANKETIAEIKNDVMATPAPLVESKAATVAQSVGAAVRYDYYAKLTDVRAFLMAVGQNEVLMATFAGDVKLRAAIETAFRPMAKAQKEHFKLPGMAYEKKPVDVSRGGF